MLPVVLVLAAPVHAAGPFIVEDANVVEAGACQLEAFIRWPRGGHSYWALPACNPHGRVEYQAGVAQLREDGTRTDLVQLQAKAVLIPADDAPLSMSVVAVVQPTRQDAPGAAWRTDFALVVPVTIALVPDRLSVNLNAALLHGGTPGKTTGAWGVSVDWKPAERWTLVAEAFRELEPRPLYQIGGFFAVIPERFEFVATYGNRFGSGSAERFFAFGIQVYTEPFLR